MILVQFLASIYALLHGASMIWLAIIEIIPFLLILLVIFWDLKRRLPKDFLLTNLRSSSCSVFHKSISPSIHFFVLQLSTGMMIQGVILVIANVLGPVAVAIFSSMRIMANVMSRFMGMIANAAWPEVTKLAAASSSIKLLQLFRIAQILFLYFGSFYLFLITSYGKVLFEWWLGDTLSFDFWLMYFLGCQVLLLSLINWGSSILMATNNHEELVRWQFVINLTALGITYIACLKFGIIGGVIFLIMSQLIPQAFFVYKILLKKKFDLIAKNFLIALIIAILLLPIFLNIWTALTVILLFTLYFVTQLKLFMRIVN
jgi:O-antigen/teichoic acid export membrane protein